MAQGRCSCWPAPVAKRCRRATPAHPRQAPRALAATQLPPPLSPPPPSPLPPLATAPLATVPLTTTSKPTLAKPTAALAAAAQPIWESGRASSGLDPMPCAG